MGALRLVIVFLVAASSFQQSFSATVSLLNRMQPFVKVEYFENCDQKVYPMMFERVSLIRNGSVLIISGEEIISRDIKTPTKIKFVIEKCKDKSNPDTCEYYTTWKWDDVCACIKLPFIGVIVNAYEPPITCPIKKNHHYVKNVRLSADIVSMFFAHSNPNVLWKVRMIQSEGDALAICCVDVGFRIVNVRVRI